MIIRMRETLVLAHVSVIPKKLSSTGMSPDEHLTYTQNNDRTQQQETSSAYSIRGVTPFLFVTHPSAVGAASISLGVVGAGRVPA